MPHASKLKFDLNLEVTILALDAVRFATRIFFGSLLSKGLNIPSVAPPAPNMSIRLFK
jgi:hypothetical protein